MAGSVVCFDIGGVLVRIRHTWNHAAEAAGLAAQLGNGTRRLNDSPDLIAYQAGEIELNEYSKRLGAWLGLGPEDAVRVHNQILIEDYPGAYDLVQQLKSKGVWTCCFSNTNGLHWTVLTDPAHFPAVASLDKKIASHELLAAKPDPAAFRQVETMFPFKADRIVFFDDTLENIYGAAEAGWEAFRLDPDADPVAEATEILTNMGIL